MSLIYKKGNETATLKDMIKMFPDCWNYAIEHDAPFWVEKSNLFNIVDLIAEITDAFDCYIVDKQLNDKLGKDRKPMNECEFENYIEQNPVWGYEDGSIDYDDIYAVLKCYNAKEMISTKFNEEIEEKEIDEYYPELDFNAWKLRNRMFREKYSDLPNICKYVSIVINDDINIGFLFCNINCRLLIHKECEKCACFESRW